MKQHLLALALMFCSAASMAAEPELHLQSNGRITLPGIPLVNDILIHAYGPNWEFAGNTAIKTTPEKVAKATGSFAMPTNSQGELSFAVHCFANVAEIELRCSENTSIKGLQHCIALNPEELAGKRYVLLPVGKRGVFPAVDVKEGIPRDSCSSIAIELKDGRFLLISGSKLLSLGLQDFRYSGPKNVQLRYHAGGGKIIGGRTLRDSLSFTLLSADELERQIAAAQRGVASIGSDERLMFFSKAGNAQVRSLDSAGIISLGLAIHGLNWQYTSQLLHADNFTLSVQPDASSVFQGTMTVPGSDNKVLQVFERVKASSEPSAVELNYDLTMLEDVQLNGYQLSMDFALAAYTNATFELTTSNGVQSYVIPEELGERFIYNGPFTALQVKATDPRDNVNITLDKPTQLLIQDNRGWGGRTIDVRLCFARSDEGDKIAAGTRVTRSLLFAMPNAKTPLRPIVDQGQPSRTDTSNWKPYTLPWDSAPVDLSFLNHKPAGKFGFVKVADGRFIFSNSNDPIRFWGTCFSAGANFPSHEQAEKIAKRLAAYGINMVRTHHADAKWAERHFFPKDADNTRSFDAENLDRFDYLMYCLKREGIYIYLDQLVNRYFKAGDGVDAVDQLGACAKPYSNFDPRLIELQKEFSANLWNHVNPYTKLAYKDDPAIALMEFANENDLFTQKVTLEPYRTRFEAMYRAWAAQQQITLPEGAIDFTVTTDPMMQFFIHVTDEYHRTMSDFLRGIGVKVPMTGSNWSRNAALLASVAKTDYTDSHAYWNHPHRDGSFGTSSMLRNQGTIMDGLGFMRVADKPFFVSEWDAPWPYEYRAELPLWLAAVAAFQDWHGLTVYTYRHSSQVPMEHINGAFETFNDPARFGLMPIAALIYRREDVRRGSDRQAVAIPMSLAASAKSPSGYGVPAYRGLAELRPFHTQLTADDNIPAGALGPDSPSLAEDLRRSSTGEIVRDRAKATLTIDTPRTQVVQAFFSDEAPALSTSALTVNSRNRYATIGLSSLSGAPIDQSRQLLLTTVGRAENTDFAYNLMRNRRLSTGKGPILMDPICARISIATQQQGLKVKPLAANGQKLAPIPAQWADGKLSFTVNEADASLYFVIED
ncbi:MAG: hypothetical protein GX945_13450 [Lentisphaerae bacterium]|nr:hypothetical protein [Lentisphaerota bacterium]